MTSDLTKSNNRETDKILATTALSIKLFINKYPDAIILVSGNTATRTRLYQIGINRYWSEISEFFTVEGYLNGDWAPFQKGKNYTSFLLYKKINL
jgi:hypothetical protein